MRLGILWTDGDITLSANLEQATRHFLNSKSNQEAFNGIGPTRLMMFKDDKWQPLKPDTNQIRTVMKTINSWYVNQHPRRAQ